jgi:hypothetical protein
LQAKNGFDLYTTFAGINVEDPFSIIDFCDAKGAGVVDVYYTDLDGSLRPSSIPKRSPSSLLSNNLGMLNFVDSTKCTANKARCYRYCEQTCFGSVRFEIDPANTEDYTLKVCKNGDRTSCIEVPGYQEPPLDSYDLSYDHRFFVAHLPTGEYDAVVLDSHGAETWPEFVSVHYEDALCPTSFSEGDINLIAPPLVPKSSECNQLIRNGDIENSDTSPTFWLHRLGGLQLVPGAGVGRSNALAGIDRTVFTTLVQYIDTRCLKRQKGSLYELSADIKLESANGDPFACDPVKQDCPKIGIFTEADGNRDFAEVGAAITKEGFQTARVVIEIDDLLAKATEARLYIKSNVDGKRMYVDNVSMTYIAS